MKTLISMTLAAMLLVASAVPANAGIGAMLGVSITTRGALAVNLSALSSDRRDRFVGAAGVSVYPFVRRSRDLLGITLGAGYQGDDWGALAGYDLVKGAPFAAAGYTLARQ